MKRGYLIVIYSLASLAIFISCHRKTNTPPQGPIITTVAGNGNGGGAPVDGAAATASIINPVL